MPAISGPPFCMDAMRKSMGKYKMTQEMGCITFETINSQVVLGCMLMIRLMLMLMVMSIVIIMLNFVEGEGH